MIFLVDHDAQRLLAIHNHRTANALGGVLATDKVALDKHLFFERGKILKQLGKRILHFRELFHSRLDLFENLSALRLFCPPGKSPVAQIPGEPDAAAHYNLVMWTFAAQPFTSARHDL
jgi:hypothetical protein